MMIADLNFWGKFLSKTLTNIFILMFGSCMMPAGGGTRTSDVEKLALHLSVPQIYIDAFKQRDIRWVHLLDIFVTNRAWEQTKPSGGAVGLTHVEHHCQP